MNRVTVLVFVSIIMLLLQGCVSQRDKALSYIKIEDRELEKKLTLQTTPDLVSGPFMVMSDGSLWSADFENVRYWKELCLDSYFGRKMSNIDDANVFSPVTLIDNVYKVLTQGAKHLVLKRNGTVWYWDAENYKDSGCMKKPIQVKGLPKIKDIALEGTGYSIAVDESGDVWQWYNSKRFLNPVCENQYDQTCSENTRNVVKERVRIRYAVSNWSEVKLSKPQKIKALANIEKIYKSRTMYTHSVYGDYFFINNDGSLFRFGSFLKAEEKKDYIQIDGKLPLYQLTLPAKIVNLIDGHALLENGHVWGLGYYVDYDYSLKKSTRYLRPYRVKGLSQVVYLSNSKALLQDGSIIAWDKLVSSAWNKMFKKIYKVNNAGNTGTDEVLFFCEGVYITRTGEIYIYGIDEIISREPSISLGYGSVTKNKYLALMSSNNAPTLEQITSKYDEKDLLLNRAYYLELYTLNNFYYKSKYQYK